MHGSLRGRLTGPTVVLAVSLAIGATNAWADTGEKTAAPARPPVAEASITMPAPRAIESTDDLVQWMTFYYAHPQPDLLVPALLYADTNGLIEKGQAPLMAFVSRVFAQNPQRIDGWSTQLNTALSARGKTMLWTAIWWSSTLEGKKTLDDLIKNLSEKESEQILAQIAQPATPLEQMDIKSPEVLDELWGAFSATGDEKYINRLISVVPWAYNANGDFNKMTIGSAARWSLTSNAQQHPLVLKTCMRARDTQPELRSMLNKIIADATKPQTNRTGQAGPSL